MVITVHCWTEDLVIAEALAQFGKRLRGRQQITDAYLVALAIHKKGSLATFDAGIASLLPAPGTAKAHLVLL